MKLERLTYAVTISLSSMLLFLLQPIVARTILPAFGGAASVWTTCMLFFQGVLLCGYLYSYLLTSYLKPRMQLVVHTAVVAFSVFMLRLGRTVPSDPGNHPLLQVLALLQVSIGPAYFLLSTTSPLVQSWYARTTSGPLPYRLFALSNLASLFALLIYPFAFERWFTLQQQIDWWRTGYLVFTVLIMVAGGIAQRRKALAAADGAPQVTGQQVAVWVLLAFCPAVLWLSLANHLSQSVAAIPFLWLLPLTLYLLSFAITFESDRWYDPRWFRWVLPVAWVALVAGLFPDTLRLHFKWLIAIESLSLFAVCIFCHGELARRKPATHSLTAFYLWVATGGALGSIFVGLLAPVLFRQYFELPLGIGLAILLGAVFGFGVRSRGVMVRLGVTVGAALAVTLFRDASGTGTRLEARNFYGALRVVEQGSVETAYRALYNGTVLHGLQWLSPTRSRWTTAYFAPESGIGRLLSNPARTPIRVGIIGLGVGTLAGYAVPGDVFRFYEINPLVVDIAKNEFRFLAECRGRVEVVEGDARIRMEHEPPQNFDLLVVDAFSGDSIPVHLLTREAFAVYTRHLKPGGQIAVHISNKYVDLAPVLAAVAESEGKTAGISVSSGDPMRRTNQARWAVITDRGSSPAWVQPLSSVKRVRVWSDDFHDLLQVID